MTAGRAEKDGVAFRHASVTDAEGLADMNAQLIRDEGHRNAMTAAELIERMRGWLLGPFAAVPDDGGGGAARRLTWLDPGSQTSPARTHRSTYHPTHEALEKCVGHDAPHLCLGCGAEVMVDSRAPSDRCTERGAGNLVDAFELDGRPCPSCGGGTFARDLGFFAVS